MQSVDYKRQQKSIESLIGAASGVFTLAFEGDVPGESFVFLIGNSGIVFCRTRLSAMALRSSDDLPGYKSWFPFNDFNI